MNPIKWLLWKLSQRIWDYAYVHNHDRLLYYSMTWIIAYSPAFSTDAKSTEACKK